MLSNIYKIGRRFSVSSIERDFSTTQEKNLQKVVTHNTTSNRLWPNTMPDNSAVCFTQRHIASFSHRILQLFLQSAAKISQLANKYSDCCVRIFEFIYDILKTQLLQDDGEKKESRLSVSHFGRWISKNPFTAYGRLSIVLRLLLNYNYYVQLWMRSGV